jgi:hypothetical protein
MLLGAILVAAVATTGLLALIWSRLNRRTVSQPLDGSSPANTHAQNLQKPTQPPPDTITEPPGQGAATDATLSQQRADDQSLPDEAKDPHAVSSPLRNPATSTELVAIKIVSETEPADPARPALPCNSKPNSVTHDLQTNDAAKHKPSEANDTMRITKRSSGGRGEYEISENHLGVTPVHILDHQIILNLGDGLAIATGVRLLLRHGKRRLRISPQSFPGQGWTPQPARAVARNCIKRLLIQWLRRPRVPREFFRTQPK